MTDPTARSEQRPLADTARKPAPQGRRPCVDLPRRTGSYMSMIALIVILLVIWAVLAILGFAIKGLLWLAILGLVFFVITAIVGWMRRGASRT